MSSGRETPKKGGPKIPKDKGSDFAEEFFTTEENKLFRNLLKRLRSFEAAVCSQFRQVGNELNINATNTSSQFGHLERSMDELSASEEINDFVLEEKFIKLEEEFEKSKMEWEDRVENVKTEINGLTVKINEEKEKGKLLVGALKTKIESTETNLTKEIDILRGRIELLEMEDVSDPDIWMENGHEHETMQFGDNETENDEVFEENENEEMGQNGEGEMSCEVMMADPFLMTVAHPGVYDGNPTMSFSRWSAKFQDLLLLCPQLTEPQKLSRLRVSLAGQARGELEAMTPAPENLEAALTFLKGKFENENTRSIARQAMSICKQAPGERVYEFANRLSEAVRTVLAGENETVVQKRLLEEFLDRLTPDLQFEVKSGRPADYSRAYELAQHFELLLASRRATQVSVAELTNKVEALAFQQQSANHSKGTERRICYYCHRQGHLVRECRKKKNDEGKQARGNRNFYANDRRDNRNFERGYREEGRGNFRYRNDWQRNRPPTPMDRNRGRQNFGYEARYNGSEENQNRSRSPRVQFRRGGMAPVRMASPILLALMAIFAIFGNAFAAVPITKPMICLPDAPISIWSLPTETICPNWAPTQIPIPFELNIYRPNTVQYKTEATACSCIKTKISRKVGIFGAKYEEIVPINEPVSTPECRRMSSERQSQAGELQLINGTLKSTTNSLEIGWGFWPVNLFWRTEEIINCFVYDTVVFTHYGMDGLNTPIGECPGCSYKSGACCCTKNSLIWNPDRTHQCPYVWLSKWEGEYSTLIWTTQSGDFALTFENKTFHSHPGCYPESGGGLTLSDQAFAITVIEFDKMIQKSQEINWQKRGKRDVQIGPVYSTQLAAQLTALSTKIAQNTQRLFTETIRKICTSLQIMAEQALTLSIANPSLLARYFLGNPFVSARLVTEKILEVKPCYPVYEVGIHFHWQEGHCFEFLPIKFDLYGKQKHGFLDPNTLIIHHKSKEANCDEMRYIYIDSRGTLTRYDQKNGEMRQIPADAIQKMTRHGKIDIPEMNFPLFRNRVLSNFSELFSPEQFNETLEGAKIMREITRISKPSSWEGMSEHTHRMTSGIVANGLFAFLRGGIFSLNQLWVFLCCCYISITFLMQFFLPLKIAEGLKYLNFGWLFLSIFSGIWQKRKIRRNETIRGEKGSVKVRDEMIEGIPIAVPLMQRWPSPEDKPQIKLKSDGRRVKFTDQLIEEDAEMQPAVLMAMVNEDKCDSNFRIGGTVNGKPSKSLMDSGAHVTLCCAKVALKFGINKLNSPEVAGIVGIGESTVPIIGQAEIKLCIAGYTVTTVLSVIEREIGRGSYDLIIGRNTFRKLPFLLDLQTGDLVRKMEQNVLNCEENSNDKGEISEKFLKNVDIKEQKEIAEIKKCLKENEKVFSSHEYDLGTCKVSAPMLLTTTEIPAQVKPYPVPEKYEMELRSHIDKMLEVGVIKESFTPWVHNIVLVKKANGQLRPCVDFRPLNRVTIADPYPLPRMDKVIFRVAGKKWYSTLDLASGFWQIPLDTESSYKCGIITPWGLYQMLKLPFGLRNAPSIFQRTMDKILEGIANVTVYIDDILIHTDTLEEHLESLRSVFVRLQKNGLKLKAEKCKLFQRKCVYLGHILSEIGYQPSLNNREVIEKFPPPKNVKEVKRFLGMVSFFRKFIPNFATIAHPLNSLTRGSQLKFEWGQAEESAMSELKKHLLKSPCLRAPNYNLAFYLFTDASAVAYGAALMQSVDGKELYAISYWSRTLSETESKLPATHGELAAIVNAIQNFRPILYGAELIILTDHRPLTFLFQKASINPKINRWLMALQEFEPKVVYLEGRANKVADALSRVPIKWESIEIKFKEEIPYLLTLEEFNLDREKVEKETKNDKTLSKIMAKIKENWVEPIENELEPFFKNRDSLYLEGNLIRKHPQGQIVIPDVLKVPILKLIHKAHFGMVKGKAKARRFVWWPKISEDIEEFTGECEICQRNAPAPPRSCPEYKWPEAKYPFERIHVDLAGPIWGTNFLITVDAYSKFPFVHQMNSTNSSALINAYREIFAVFGSPRTLVSDNGPQFVSAEFNIFLSEEGINHLTSPPYHPPSNGEAERFVRTFKEGIKKLLDSGKTLQLAQFILLQEYRSTPCQMLGGETPAQKFLKREMRTEMDKIKIMPPMGKNRKGSLSENPKALEPMAHVPTKEVQSRNEFYPGDAVWVRDQATKKWIPSILLQPMGERLWKAEMEGGGERVAHSDLIKRRKLVSRHI